MQLLFLSNVLYVRHSLPNENVEIFAYIIESAYY